MKPVFQTSQFKRDIKRLKKRGKNLEKLGDVVRRLALDEPLEEKHRDHPLMGKWAGSRDSHVAPDWILIYRNESDSIFSEGSGSHSDLFKN